MTRRKQDIWTSNLTAVMTSQTCEVLFFVHLYFLFFNFITTAEVEYLALSHTQPTLRNAKRATSSLLQNFKYKC